MRTEPVIMTFAELTVRHNAEVCRLYESGRLNKLCTGEDREATYRRAYSDGYITALDDLHTLVIEKRLSRERAYNLCWDHWELPLLRWLRSDCSKRELPPSVEVSK